MSQPVDCLTYAQQKMAELATECGGDKDATMLRAFALLETDAQFRIGRLTAGLNLSIDAAVAVKH